jgi:hypothetical protein
VLAVHEIEAAVAEANGAAAQLMRLPLTSGRNGARTKRDFSDGAVRAAGKPAIKAGEDQSEPAPLVRCQAVRRPARSADRHGVPQKTRGLYARKKAAVERLTTAAGRAVSAPPMSATGSALYL